MNNIIPFFELDGVRYEIKTTRYLIAEYDKMKRDNGLSNDDKTNSIKAQSLVNEIQRYGNKTQELWDKFEQEPNKENKEAYIMVKELYDNALEALAKLEVETNCTTTLQKQAYDILEKLAIKGLAEQYFYGNEKEATLLWERFANTLPNHEAIQEWLAYMSDCLFNNEDIEDNSFLSQMRKRAEQRANNRKSLTKRR